MVTRAGSGITGVRIRSAGIRSRLTGRGRITWVGDLVAKSVSQKYKEISRDARRIIQKRYAPVRNLRINKPRVDGTMSASWEFFMDGRWHKGSVSYLSDLGPRRGGWEVRTPAQQLRHYRSKAKKRGCK